jgi:hypothetical protein
MSAFDSLKNANFLNWQTLLIGLERGWCQKENLIQYAESVLEKTVGETDGDLVTIVSGSRLPEDALISTALQFMDSHGLSMSEEKKFDALEKWRFAHLSSLLHSVNSDEEKVSALQELYAEFGFQEDMISCSIYSNTGVDPIVAAIDVSERLFERLT